MVRLGRVIPGMTASFLSISFADLKFLPNMPLNTHTEKLILDVCKVQYGGWEVISITDIFKKSVVLG